MRTFLKIRGILERTLESAEKRLAESRNRVPAVPHRGPYGSSGWPR